MAGFVWGSLKASGCRLRLLIMVMAAWYAVFEWMLGFSGCLWVFRQPEKVGTTVLQVGESVALLDVAGLQAALQPLFALGGCAVGVGVRHGVALRALLQVVVADGVGG